MSYLDHLNEDIKRLERRIKKISENPDPKQLRCNKLLYQIRRDSMIEQAKAVEENKVVLSLGMFADIVAAMGYFPYGIINHGWEVSPEVVNRYLELIRGADYPDTACDAYQMAIGMLLNNELPPLQIALCSGSCDVAVFADRAVAHTLGLPYYYVDVRPGMHLTSRYMEQQIQQGIAFAEKHLPGAKLDMAKLEERVKKTKMGRAYLWEIGQMLKHKPAPLHGRDAFRIYNPGIANEPGGLEYLKAFRDEIRERIEKKNFPVPDEQLRIMWVVSAPIFIDIFKILERHNASMPLYVQATTGGMWGLGPKEYHEEGSPWGGPAYTWVNQLVEMAKEVSIDGVVYYMNTGCIINRSCSRMVVEGFEKELNIPVLLLEGTMLNPERFNMSRDEESLEEFLDLCLKRKKNKNR
ncbi:MAG: 2-hydroxyacyl-CoA dehydratase [Dehalococcoidales bacterium]|nr:2-hydroxyacyl-CoA dehydratase [Dehalococcoidales bacterium]